MSRMAVAPPPVGFRVSDSDSGVRGRGRVMGFWREMGLREASETDGKAARNLEKLKLFKQFYMVWWGTCILQGLQFRQLVKG